MSKLGKKAPVDKTIDKPKHFKQTMKSTWTYLREYNLQLTLVVIFAIASTIFMIVSPRLLGDMTNEIVDGYVSGKTYDAILESIPEGTKIPEGTTGKDLLENTPSKIKDSIPAAQLETINKIDLSDGRPDINYGAIQVIGLWLIGLYVLSSLFLYIQGWIMTNVTQRLVYGLRKKISQKINKLSLGYFDRNPYGEVISRVTNDVDTIGQTLNQSASEIITSVVTILGIIVMMLTISWEMTLIAIIVLPVSLGIIAFIAKASQKYFRTQQNGLGELNGHVEEMFSGHVAMRTYNGESRSIETFNTTNEELYDSGWKSQFISGLMMPMMQFVGNLGLVGVAVVGGWLAVNGRVSIGGIQAFVQYMNQFTQPIRQAANITNVMQTTVAAAERVFEFLDEPVETPSSVTSSLPKKVKGSVGFDGVNFSYEAGSPIIKNFSTDVNPGQRIAIVGPTGAGKTTIVNLLMRFYEIESGQIMIDGIDSRAVSRADIRKQFGMVLQDTWLFSGSVADNISYGRPGATREEIVSAAKAAHADGFIRTLPNGYDTAISEESDNVSAGEKQLLTIARAMLADAPMLILDEATSSVDTRTELLIQEAMDRLTKGRTSFVIAHRLSTIRGADRILVMKDGNIIEQGTHDELIAEGGFYESLYESQFEVES